MKLERNYAGAENTLQLFDLAMDPGETRDVSAEHPDLVRRLEEQLQATSLKLGRERRADPPNVLDDMDRDVLEALGYLH